MSVTFACCAALLIVLAMSLPALGAKPPDSYLLRTALALERCRADIAAMQSPAETAASLLAKGGQLYAAGEPSLVSEVCGRAGGFMMIRHIPEGQPPAAGDVVMYFPEKGAAVPGELLSSGACVVACCDGKAAEPAFTCPSHAAECGLSPTLAAAIPAWLFTGELVAALTRLGKMPVLFESIGLYGGVPRMNKYLQQGVLWHDDRQVPPIPAGKLANEFADRVAAMLRRVERDDRRKLEQAGEWAAAAKQQGKRLIMYSMGHLFPREVENTAIGGLFESAVWNSGFSYSPPPDHAYQAGDVLIHVGYQHPPTLMLERAKAAGARVVYVDILADRDYTRNRDVLWVDPMWPWADACVPIQGYDVPALASSGVVNGAIAWELYRLTRQRLPGSP